MAIKNRAELKSFFVKNAIPTEENFADLIDSQLNQSEDGVFKRDREPLSVVAAPGDQRRVLSFYSHGTATTPDWMLSLNPAQDPKNPASGKPGFGITNGAGQTRLFVDAKTGRVGLGTNTPQALLDVDGGLQVNGDTQINSLINGTKQTRLAVQAESGRVGVGTGAPQATLDVAGSLQVEGDVRFNSIVNEVKQTRLCVQAKSGWVGVGTSTPQAPLDVVGDVQVTGDVQVKGLIKDRTGYIVPPGGIIMWSGDAANIPEGWVLCDGANGTPDLRDRFILGHGPNSAMGKRGGASTVALTRDQMPAHSHANGNYKYLVQKEPSGKYTNVGTDTTKGEIDILHGLEILTEGKGQAHENMPPYHVLAFIMKK